MAHTYTLMHSHSTEANIFGRTTKIKWCDSILARPATRVKNTRKKTHNPFFRFTINFKLFPDIILEIYIFFHYLD